MKQLTKILITLLLMVGFVVINSFVWYAIYHLGLRPFINECGASLPNISFVYFVLLSISYNMFLFTDKKHNEIYDVNDKSGIIQVLEVLFVKLISIFILFVINCIFI